MASEKTREHNAVAMREERHACVNKPKCHWLALTLINPEAQSRSNDISMFYIEKCK